MIDAVVALEEEELVQGVRKFAKALVKALVETSVIEDLYSRYHYDLDDEAYDVWQG